MPWGQVGLSSSLGGTGGGGWGSVDTTTQAPAHSSSGPGWLGSITNPLGLRTGLTQLGTGIVKGIVSPLFNAGYGIGELATGQGSEARTSFRRAVQGVGDIGGAVVPAAENLASTALLPFGGPHGLSEVASRDVFQPFNKWLSDKDAHGEGTWNAFLSPEVAKSLYNEGQGEHPVDWWTAAEHQGIGAATVKTGAELAMVAAPVAGVTSAVAGYADAAAGAAEAAGATAAAESYATKADRFNFITSKIHEAGTPFKTTGRAFADLLSAQRAEAYPAEVPAAAPSPDEVIPHEELVSVREGMHPAAAGAEGMTTASNAQQSLLGELSAANVLPETTRLYRRGPNGDFWSSNPETKAVGETVTPDRLQHIDVPNARLGDLATGRAGEYNLGEAQDLQQAAVEHPAGEAARIEPRVEPRKYDVSKGAIVSPEERTIRDEQLRSDTAAAREHVDPALHVVDEVGQRINMPAPEWATRAAELMPDSVNRLMGRLGANYIDRVRLQNVQRNIQQAMETAQNTARSSPAMRAGVDAAHLVLDKVTDRGTASARIGEEIQARLNGEALMAEWVKNHSGQPPNDEVSLRLEKAGRGGYKGVDDEMLAKLSPEDRAQWEKSINEAVAGFKAEAAKTMETLLATRYGAKGLERALLDPNEPPMTAEQVRLYKRSERDLRYAAKARERIPGEVERRISEASKATAEGAKAHGFTDELRARLGTTLQTVQDLFKGVPEGLKDDGARTVALALSTVGEEGGALIDVATGTALHPTSGIYVPLASQFDVPLDQWATQGPQLIHEALFQPKATGGNVYDPQALYGGLDARLAINLATGPDGSTHVVGTISQATINGEAMAPWQAYVLGSAHEQAAGFDFATGKPVAFADNNSERALMANYVGDVLNTRSDMTRWANERAKVVDDPTLNVTHEQLHAEMTANLWLDHLMRQRNAQWNKGDIFNSELSMAKGEPTLPYMAQTIMDNLTTNDHVDKAMVAADTASVNNMLAWYYKSHEFIENLYRGKTIPLTGRDAAETFYDVLALTSVMASPTQNLGRALAGFANLDDFLSAHEQALTDTQSVMDEVMGNKPNNVVYVKGLGTEEERVVPKGQGGTPVAQRWLDSPAARELSHQTSMTTGPKYRIIDALLGRFNLESATAEDIAGQPEWWTGNAHELSDANLSPQAVLHHAQLLNTQGSEMEAYRQWAVTHYELAAARDVRNQPGWVKPITDAENVEAKASDTAGQLGDNREVSPQEYQNLAQDGRAYVEQAIAGSTPHVLTGGLLDGLRNELFGRTRSEWGGATVDAHTGQLIPDDYHGDTYAVTARLKGMKPIAIDPKASEAVFTRTLNRAIAQYKVVLDSEGGHLGVFYNGTTGKIEFDPVYNTQTPHDTEAVGTYTHAVGGAYHFRSGNGYWIPHVRDDLTWDSKAQATQTWTTSLTTGHTLSKAGPMRQAYENALLEYHGSGALAKLRSFRDNLAHPQSSLAVTLDSIMAQLFGFDKTHWGVKGEYAKYADTVRESAAQWSEIAGRPVQPHEIQALLWVYAKRFIGEQDWGRLQAHVGNVHTVIDTLESAVADGKQINVKNFDPLGPWWKQELQFSRDQLAVRTERKGLRMKRTAGTLTPEETSRLDYLEQVPTRQETQALIQAPDGTVDYQNRNETSYDAKVLSHKEDQYVDYLKTVVAPMRKAIAKGDFNEARSIIDEYTAGRRKSILGSVEGGEFGPKMLRDPESVGAQSIARLQYANHVPAPNPEAMNTGELYSAFGDRVRGVTLENPNRLGRIMMRLYSTADVSTLLHEDLHAFRLMAPGDEVAELSTTYPHLQDATLTPERIADEEKFVGDFMGYLRARSTASDTRLSPAMQARVGVRYTGPLARLFNNVADLMDQHYGPAFNTEAGQAVPNEIVNYWDSIFNADIQRPDQVEDPLSAQYAPTNKGVNPTQARGESPFAFTQRTRQYGEARGSADVLEQRVRDAEARARQADKFANTMAGLVLEPTRSEIVAQRLEDRAVRTFDKIAGQLEGATGNQVPRGWRPFLDSIDRIREEAKDDPALADLLKEIPENFAQAMRFAAQQGFDPTYMPELTWDMAQKYMYGHLQLGVKAAEAGLRRENLGVLNKAGVVDRSLEALGAGTVMAMKELLSSRMVQFVEENYARELAPGTPIPEGWKPWDSTRDAIITGRNLNGREVAVNANKIIPDSVYNTLRGFQKPALDLPFRFLWKGAPVAVWKHLLLTYSPTWYLKHFIGAVSLATAEGVRPTDWATAWRQWKTDTLPDVVRGRNVYTSIDEVLGTRGTIIPRTAPTELPELIRAEGFKIAAREINNKLRGVVKVVDGMGRAAVYAKTLRTGGSAALAASRAYEALGDFGRLSPIERSMVTQVIPFYSFQKAMFRILLRLPNEHPLATGLLMQLGSMHQAYLKDQLGGSIPDAYLGSDFVNGHLVALDKFNPLVDSWRITTPDGIASSANPFIRLFAQDALHSPTYGAQAGMDAQGNLIQQPNLGQTILDTYTGAVPGVGKPLGRDMLNITSGLSDAQYQKLLKRILKTQNAENTVDAGGYLVTDAYKPKQTAKLSRVWGG